MQTDSIAELAKAFAKAQGEMEGATKDSVNPHFRSKYADLGAVVDACRPALSKHGLSVIQMPRSVEGQLRIVTRLCHESGEWIEDDGFPLILAKEDMQGLGAATTYARRYGLMSVVGIAPEDDDGNSVSGQQGKPVKAAPRTEPPKQTTTPATQAEKERKVANWVDAQKAILTNEMQTKDDLDDWKAMHEGNLATMKEHWSTYHKMIMDVWNERYQETDFRRMAG